MTVCVNVIVVTYVLFAGFCVTAQDRNAFEEDEKEPRSLRKDMLEGDQWKAVENIQLDTSGWIPDYTFPQQPTDQLQPKRRRLRKRKRRPQIISLTDTDNEMVENRYPARRIKRPQHLNEDRDLWTQMEADSKDTPTNRRRVTPAYHDKRTEEEIEVIQADQPVDVATEGQVPDLKTILKQANGVSLSEILQRKNLTLTDLLKGETEAIFAITEKPDNQVIVTEYRNPVMEDSPKKKHNSNYRSTTQRISVKSERISESTRRVSVKPNNVIVVDFKPSLDGLDIATNHDIPETSSTTTPVSVEVQHKRRNPSLPLTNAKLKKVLKSKTPAIENEVFPTTIPPKAYRIDIKELFGVSSVKPEVERENSTQEGPLRMSLDLNKVLERRLETSTNPQKEVTTEDAMPQKLKTITAKDEILEVLADEETKLYLKKVLELRNMTFEDLVALRERGSSQRHLADLFHNNTKEPEPKDEPLVGAVRKEESSEEDDERNEISDKYLERQAKSHVSIPSTSTDSNGDRYVASIIEEKEPKSIEETKERSRYTVTSFPTYKIQSEKKRPQPAADSWKSNYPELFSDFYRRTHQRGIVEDLEGKYFDEVENGISDKGSEKLNVEEVKETYEDGEGLFIRLPYGVKHAIIASLLIIGMSLVIFLTILLIFKWSQKHKSRLCYGGRFPCSKIKSPIMQEDVERRSFRTFMSETLGRKKGYYKQHLQSVSDGIWENDRKPFQ